MLEGKYYLIKRSDHKWKFYWAPYEPAPKNDFDDWGVAVIDTHWKTDDPRPKHLRGKPLGYQLQPWIQVLRDPNVYSEKYDMYGKDWRGYSLTYEVMRCLIHSNKNCRRMLSVGVCQMAFPDSWPKQECSFFYKENLPE
ncbi:hypothetical protein ACQRBI_01910 [Lactobacillus johnsonii]|uniref:hypothetical protein n=1 Tax=Lactobacillus johnsonii TaxID=33959 RepID=UPI002A769C92|nr:hypothetical protein [Ligilactobacillus salivarius]MDY4500535.1 hypothetical protein [Lactobacillus johnsonii]